ncbi:hypothetical protein ACFQ6N_00960 [Kitasatospora sp. NPDC056446]|uniref:hypothetical protein n=1 Tax=Kitasatospora sp. NPDC056446 TaxID=3345819 RepID=UPI0036A8485D
MTDRMGNVDRSGLVHAMGPATDTPRRLAALRSDGPDDAEAIVDGYPQPAHVRDLETTNSPWQAHAA